MISGQPGTPELHIHRLDPRATIPAYQSDLAAGLDLAACLPEGVNGMTIDPLVRGGRITMIGTGLALAIPPGFEGQVRPRSGLASKHGLSMPNSPGTIDADYRGELRIPLMNLGAEPFEVTQGMRIAQLVISPVAHARVIETASLDQTARGAGGFGSTGVL